MNKPLTMAFYGEGHSDYQFLLTLIRRVVETACRKNKVIDVEIEDIRPLDPDKRIKGKGKDRIVQAAAAERDQFDILFIHADADDRDWKDAYEYRVKPGAEMVRNIMNCGIVSVIPVRMMEAWTLADGKTLIKVFKAPDGCVLPIPAKPSVVEKELDPKETLNKAYREVQGSRVRRRGAREQGTDFLADIAREIDIAVLKQVPSFRRFESELIDVLRELEYLDPI